MKFAYPASSSIDSLTPLHIALKIARHCPCTACENCKGLHPSIGVHVVLDDGSGESILGELGQYGSDDDDEKPSAPPYLDICACGHGVAEHGANELQIGTEEYRRRASYAIRIDENMQVMEFIPKLKSSKANDGCASVHDCSVSACQFLRTTSQ
ncbi:histone gcn5 superfamily [Lentinula edodes]|uniref:Histone gcn5 superfamily n=1 Tax=Lentinula edodes TaxID=5353 RepID=A0A1Q3EAS3_LENED|nr:histone gcn5 superfamily [Lentinula edodes]